MNIVFCADRRVLPGLHVVTYSLLEKIQLAAATSQVYFFVFSNELDEADMDLLRQTLLPLKKNFTLKLSRLNTEQLAKFPLLNGSLAAYYRLLAAQMMDVEQFLYLDVDMLCEVDVSELISLNMGDAPAGLVSEATLALAVDRFTSEQLGNSLVEPYFNSGVILVNVAEWRRQQVTERAMAYIANHRPPFHDQSALNYVLYRKVYELDAKYNYFTNMRRHWPTLCRQQGQTDRLLHFLDYPKPWNLLGEFVHPQYECWHSVLKKTAMKNFHSWQGASLRQLPKTRKALVGYKKALKDRWLFAGYSRGWIKHVKGVKSGVL